MSNKWDAQTLQAGQDVAWNDRLLQSDQSKSEGNQDVNLERGAASEAFQKFTLAQSSHGFSVLDCVRHDGTDFVEATADTESNARVIGLVTEVIDTDNFVIQAAGRVTGASGLTGGSVHYLQDAGGLGTTEGAVEVPILLADSSSTGWLLPLGQQPSGTSASSGALQLTVRNDTGSTITAGSLVEIHDATASQIRVRPADKDTSVSADGIAIQDIPSNDEGDIRVGGTYSGVDTSGLTEGDPIWLGDDGGFVDSAPTSGVVIRVGKVGIVAADGSIALRLPAFEAQADETAYDNASSGLAAENAQAAIDEVDRPQSFVIACSDESSDLSTGTAKVTFRMPYAFTVEEVRASVTTAPTGSGVQVDINEAGSSILSTEITIDDGDKTSEDASTPPSISDADLADDAEVTIDVDAVGSTTPGAGLKVTIIGRPA